jgi:hypothetical protein
MGIGSLAPPAARGKGFDGGEVAGIGHPAEVLRSQEERGERDLPPALEVNQGRPAGMHDLGAVVGESRPVDGPLRARVRQHARRPARRGSAAGPGAASRPGPGSGCRRNARPGTWPPRWPGSCRPGRGRFPARPPPVWTGCQPAELLQPLQVVMRGDALLSPGVTRRLVSEFVARPPDAVAAVGMETLTNREREVVALSRTACPPTRSPTPWCSAQPPPRPM